MDDINEEDPNAGRCEPVHVSKSGGLLTVLRTSEHDNAVEKQETGKCGHFSIRRYVAETRKKDWKSCWPFLKPEDPHKLEAYPMPLPPLSVPEFRWWHCQNCLKNNGTDGTGEVLMNCLGEQRPNIALVDGLGLLPSDNSTKLLLEVQSSSGKSKGEDGAGYMLKSNAPENDVTSIHPFSGDASEKMVQYVSPEQDNQVMENNVNQINYETICDVIDAEPCKKGERVTEEAGEVTSTFDLNKLACDLSSSETISTSRPVSCQPVASEAVVSKSMGNEEGFQEVLPNQEIVVIGSHVASPISMKKGIEEPNCMNDLEVSVEITKDNGEVEITKDIGEPQLADVVTGEEIRHNAVAIPVNELDFQELAESDDEFPPDNYNLDTSESPCGPSNVMLQQKRMKRMRSMTDILNSEHLVFSNENNKNPSKNKGNKQKKVPGVENSESSLICRPKDMLEKLQGHVIDDENNRPQIDAESKTEERFKGNVSAENENSWVAREEMQHLTLGDDELSRELATKNNDTAQSKNDTSKKSKKLPRIHDLNSLPQESPGIGKCRTFQDSQLPQEVIAHERTAPVNNERHQAASLDDIPTDIVELLAIIQHERRLQNAEAAKEGRVDKSETAQNKSFNIMDLTGKSMENYEKKLKNSSHTSSNLKDIGVKQPERRAQGFVPWSQAKQKTTGYQFRSPDPSTDCERMSRTSFQWLDQCHKNQMGLTNNSFGPSKHGASVPLHTILHDTSSTKASSSTTPGGSYNLNSANLDFYLQSQKKVVEFQAGMNRENVVPSKHGASVPLHAIIHDTSSTKASSSTTPGGSYNLNSTNLDFYLQQSQKKTAQFQAELNRELFVPYSYPHVAKDPNTGVHMEMHSEKIPAMQLLRLVNQGAYSSTPATLRMHENQGNFLQKNHFGHSEAHKFFKLVSSGIRETNRPSLHHKSFQSIHQKLQQGNPFEIFHPMATASSVGPLPDIPTHSNSYGLPVGFTSALHTEMQASSSQAGLSTNTHSNSNGLPVGFTTGFHTEMLASSSKAHEEKKTRNAQSLGLSTNTYSNNYGLPVGFTSGFQNERQASSSQAHKEKKTRNAQSLGLSTNTHSNSNGLPVGFASGFHTEMEASSSQAHKGNKTTNVQSIGLSANTQSNSYGLPVGFTTRRHTEMQASSSQVHKAKKTGNAHSLGLNTDTRSNSYGRPVGFTSWFPTEMQASSSQALKEKKTRNAQSLGPSTGTRSNSYGLPVGFASGFHTDMQASSSQAHEGKKTRNAQSLGLSANTHSNSDGLPVGFNSGFHTEVQASSSQAHVEKTTRNAQSFGLSANLRPNDFLPAVNISSYTDALHLRGVLTGHNIEQNNQKALALPVESSSNTEFCSVNRNPAEFTMPEDGNIYMIGSDDLKFGNLSPLKDPDARKRQRTMKDIVSER